jgi:hypothetical protein
MNFKTTGVLIVALVVLCGMWWFTRSGQKTSQEIAPPLLPEAGAGPRLMDLDSAKVNRLTIVDAAGGRTSLQRTGDQWRLLEPVDAPAATWGARSLVATIVELRSRGRPAADPGAASGLAKPRYRIDVSTEDGKSAQLLIGAKTGIGDAMYAQVGGGEVNLIDADLETTLKTAADDLRDKSLVRIGRAEVKQLRIVSSGRPLALALVQGKWKITEPAEMPGDETEIKSFVGTLRGEEVTEYLAPNSDELAFAQFDRPTAQIWINEAGAATQPAATEPWGPATVTVGGPDSLAKDHYYVKTADAQFGKISSSTLVSLKMTALELRDRDVLAVPPADVVSVWIEKRTYATGPATQPAGASAPIASQIIKLTSLPAEIQGEAGPALPKPVTQPTTQPASRAAGPRPVEEESAWRLVDDPRSVVDDAKVKTLLDQFRVLRVEGYLETAPHWPVAQRYAVTLMTRSARYEINFIKSADGQSTVGFYNGLTFDAPGAVVDALDADFRKAVPK